ncbi:Survival motor neuron-like protein 1 [Colletotrichum higginsianum]|uniref:Survival motor neuron-like protein 1 n=1 Tax=Colletotrichum higginsianum TaxID=80884 RepID=A0A4V4NBX5_9PEZI|nr:Survival motor neuron-like protein 1 [Colletotrichum higginsianum]
MADNDMEMTHAEMWDDSALIDSWNEALDEYKKYHSIHAKGGRLKDSDLQGNPEPHTLDAQPQAVDQLEIVPGTEGASKTEEAGSSTEVKQPLDPSGNPGRSEKLGSVLMHLVRFR